MLRQVLRSPVNLLRSNPRSVTKSNVFRSPLSQPARALQGLVIGVPKEIFDGKS